MSSQRSATIVLAAGRSRRFGADKLSASLDGRPILQHVLDALAAAGISDPVVVLGGMDGRNEEVIRWRQAHRIRNPDPDRGLATSLQLGWAAVMAPDPAPVSVLVVLGDQPRLDPGVIRILLRQPLDGTRPVIVARHADGARNPVRLEPEATSLVAAASGDRGLGPIVDAQPELVRNVDVDATNPDIDVRDDLVRLLEQSWADRVRANAAQVERIREVADGHDFYAPVTRMFVADPGRSDDPVLAVLTALAQPDDRWLDIGAGAGRYALPIATRVRDVIAVDPSTSMLAALRSGAAARGIANICDLEGRWPPDPTLRAALGRDPVADVAVIAHVGYDIAAIGPFLDAMEAAARRRCVAVLMEESPASIAAPFWSIVHGELRVALPALPQLVELLVARGAAPEVMRIAGERRRWADREEFLGFLRRQLWTAPGTPADRRLVTAVDEQAATTADGSVDIPGSRPIDIGIVNWMPTHEM